MLQLTVSADNQAFVSLLYFIGDHSLVCNLEANEYSYYFYIFCRLKYNKVVI